MAGEMTGQNLLFSLLAMQSDLIEILFGSTPLDALSKQED